MADVPTAAGLRERVASVPYWYHTLELAPGVVTPGHFDLRGVVDRFPWPDVSGKRCLDVATFDGFYAFELERRGAAEVVAIDLDDQAGLDWLPREVPPEFRRGDEPVGRGFQIAAEALGSGVERVVMNVYDLAPSALGAFDVVVCGALLEHLRDPFGALLRMRSVCAGSFLSVELVDTLTSTLLPRVPVQRLMTGSRTWALPNVAGHRHMLDTVGFDVTDAAVVGVPLGPGVRPREPHRLRGRVARRVAAGARRRLGGTDDLPFSTVLATPATGLQSMPEGANPTASPG